MNQFITAALGASLLMVTGCRKTDNTGTTPTPAQWNFENTNWPADGYSECASQTTSPVNIDTTKTTPSNQPALVLNYQPMTLQILDNGQTIQVQGDGRNAISYGGVTYLLKQFHFHRASEHTINGQSAPMEVHLVHQDDRTGARLVLAAFLTNGPQNPAVQAVFSNLPTQKDQLNTVPNVSLSLTDLLPRNRALYRYVDASETPACSLPLTWIVFKNPVSISAGQEATFAQKYPRNNRPLQPLNNRQVLEQD